MDTPIDPVLIQLCGADERSFERGLRALGRRWEGVADSARLSDLLVALRGFGETQALGPTEVSRRVRLTVEATRLPERQSRELACSLPQLPPTVRQAVIACLPASLRRLAYAPQATAETGNTTLPATASSANPIVSPREATAPSVTTSQPRECASVILLGTYVDHEENRQTLERRGFTSLRATTVAQLNEFLDHEVCGVVVARSWWPGIPEPEREKSAEDDYPTFELRLAEVRHSQPPLRRRTVPPFTSVCPVFRAGVG